MNAPATVDKTTRQLRPGDRVWIPLLGGHTRIVRVVEPAGYIGQAGYPVMAVRYDTTDLDPAGPFYSGNSALEADVWQVIR